jgi:hypothetical protein
MVTIREAIKERRNIEVREDRTYFGGFPVPEWFVEQCEQAAAREAADRKRLREKFPGHFLRSIDPPEAE